MEQLGSNENIEHEILIADFPDTSQEEADMIEQLSSSGRYFDYINIGYDESSLVLSVQLSGKKDGIESPLITFDRLVVDVKSFLRTKPDAYAA